MGRGGGLKGDMKSESKDCGGVCVRVSSILSALSISSLPLLLALSWLI